MMLDRLGRFEQILAGFPESVRPWLIRLPEQQGKLDHNACQELMKRLNISLEQLMVRLLPVAGVFAAVPISGFKVGAVVQTECRSEPLQKELYMGANFEFEHQTLHVTLHAEQSAAVNAWHQNCGRLLAVATSETPCGHCRQFLHEFYGGKDAAVILPGNQRNEYRMEPLANLLPQPFTPSDLELPIMLMAPRQTVQPIKLQHDTEDSVVAKALAAASLAYVPYSGNLAGCAIKTTGNRIVSGRNLESAAFNPSVSPLQAAIICMNLMNLQEPLAAERVVLVERPTKVRQKESVQMLMKAFMPGIILEYHLAQEET